MYEAEFAKRQNGKRGFLKRKNIASKHGITEALFPVILLGTGPYATSPGPYATSPGIAKKVYMYSLMK